MKKYLYIKFVLAFFILGFIGFFIVALAGSSMAEHHVESVYSNQLYRKPQTLPLTELQNITGKHSPRKTLTRISAQWLLIRSVPSG